MNIGKAIKELRLEKNLNQTELAKQCDLTQTSLSQIESGIKRPNPSTLKKLCDFFEVPEAVVYLIATDISDVPEHKRELFEKLFPNLKKALIDMLIK
ncbi:helix-turn-helix domain-containing protein [Mucilaginibacter sp. KACC 22773]|uniref:helix-turn-helix domain-containing protein n=1 Tax=Mucilaginibacter sp. KACC 22773 TaxID=3025671 RepID=UPI002366928F|nr:helix-turn-helix domain-containing protein [Mucilaginibacter sp. KACC 22773]WDF76136.1 helix-turn-helix domain-containing protein [Mucilaginibacter sp. KACC 22773]